MKEFAQFRLDTVNQCLWRHMDTGNDERILLTPKAFAVLRHLVERAGRLVNGQMLLQVQTEESIQNLSRLPWIPRLIRNGNQAGLG